MHTDTHTPISSGTRHGDMVIKPVLIEANHRKKMCTVSLVHKNQVLATMMGRVKGWLILDVVDKTQVVVHVKLCQIFKRKRAQNSTDWSRKSVSGATSVEYCCFSKYNKNLNIAKFPRYLIA